MTDAVTIRRCVLRIRRHGGWSWGPDPDALLGAATRALPRLIAEHLKGVTIGRGGGDVRITAPVRLHVKATVDELVALAASARTGEPVPGGVLAQRLDEAFAQALTGAGVDTVEPEAASVREVATEQPPPQPASHRAVDAVIATLLRWQRDHVLVELLAAMPADVRARWLAEILALASPVPAGDEPSIAARHASAVAAAISVAEQVAAEHEPIVVALAAIAAALVIDRPARDVVASDARVLAAVRAEIPVVRDAHASVLARGETPVTTHAGAADPDARAPARGPQVAAAALTASPVLAPFVTSALPFLALVPLARCGWLEAAAAILDGTALAPALVAALAYKLLPPPEQGWLRAPAHRDTAAVLAGRSIDDAGLADAERALAGLADALVAPLTSELRRGHRRGAPLLLVRDGERFAMIDTEGVFVLAAGELMRAVDAARGLGEAVLVPAAVATPRVLDALECANLVFVTDAPPARGAPWRPVPRARLWTNDGGAAERHASLATVLADADDLATEILEAMRARPALPRSDRGVLDRIATQAAALALGDIAWNLFRARETPTPMLALERFASLDVHVTPTPDRIEVRVPLGRRHSDLLAHGYLTALPWLDGRALHLMGG